MDRAYIAEQRVFVECDVTMITEVLHFATGYTQRAQIPEDEMVVRSASDESVVFAKEEL
jgi:hypothetical protein